MNDDRVYAAGVARVDVTPPAGIRLIGYAVREGFSLGTDQPLTLTALALGAANDMVLLLAVDACIIYIDFAQKLRERCAVAAGVPSSHVLLNFSHTHSAPATDGYLDFDTADQLELQAGFRALLLERGAAASRDAVATQRPARLAVGWGECHSNINRRQATRDRGTLLGENPEGPCDRTVGVLRVDDLAGIPIAIAYRYSCHTVTLGPKTNLFSPDFVGPARNLIEGAICCPTLFLQGCAGNLNPVTGIGQDEENSPSFKEDMRRIGESVGAEVLKVTHELRTHRRRTHPRLVHSVAEYWLYEYELIPEGKTGVLHVTEVQMKLPLAPFPEIGKVRAERDQWSMRLRDARNCGEREWVIGPLQVWDEWSKRRLAAAESGLNPMEVSFPVQALQIGELRIVALPFETMAETGLDLRASLGDDTFVLGYSNGMVSYLPTPRISAEGGMEAKSAYQAYLLPSELPGHWEPQIRSQIEAMFNTKQTQATPREISK